MMSAILKSINGSTDSSVNQSVQTKFWGLTCETGLKYNQRVRKKYCVTQVVLDPDSTEKDGTSKFVSVMVKHDEGEHIMAVLKHGEIYQVNLNIFFDRENVTFYLKGSGTVNILGYEVVEPKENSLEVSPISAKGTKSLKQKSNSPSNAEPSGKSAITKIGKKAKKHEDNDEDEDEEESVEEYMNLLGDDLETSSDEEDEDFSLGEAEIMDDEDDDDDEDEEEEEEDADLELDSDEESDDFEDEDDINKPGPSTSQKRKKKLTPEILQKRLKLEEASSSKATNSVPQDDSSDDVQEIPISKKKEKKLKKAKQEMDNAQKMDKGQKAKNQVSSRTLEGGLEITDLKVGHGPEARKGKFCHVFYVGRLPNKEIFDAVLPGKKPFGFRLGKQEVIKGWDVGLEGMKVGGKRKIKVPAHMGYGKKSIDKIPANSTLYFTVDLQHVS